MLQLLVPARPGEGLDLGDAVPAAGYLVVLLALGAAIGLQLVSLRFTQQMQQHFGSGPAMRRLRRIVLRSEPARNEEEAVEAARYAPAAAVAIPLQVLASTLLLAAVGASVLMQLLTLDVGPVLHTVQAILLLLLVGTAGVLVPVEVRSARRGLDYRPARDVGAADARG